MTTIRLIDMDTGTQLDVPECASADLPEEPMSEPTDHKLTVAMVTSDLTDCEDFPEGPCVILRGSKEAVKAAAQHFGETVTLTLVDQST